jgi:hypothetical protein
MKTLLSVLVFVSLLTGADPSYIYYKSTSLSGAAEKVTVQQPSSAARNVRFKSASVYCSVACTVTISRDGTAATTTAGTVVALSADYRTPKATVFHTSNAGSGTTLFTQVIAAGATFVFDLVGIELDQSSTARNLSIGTDSITGTATIAVKWEER